MIQFEQALGIILDDVCEMDTEHVAIEDALFRVILGQCIKIMTGAMVPRGAVKP